MAFCENISQGEIVYGQNKSRSAWLKFLWYKQIAFIKNKWLILYNKWDLW